MSDFHAGLLIILYHFVAFDLFTFPCERQCPHQGKTRHQGGEAVGKRMKQVMEKVSESPFWQRQVLLLGPWSFWQILCMV